MLNGIAVLVIGLAFVAFWLVAMESALSGLQE
jgi:hypothetical protein